MSDTGTAMSYQEAQAVADAFMEHLTPFCSQVEISGSLRRHEQSVGDIEIICQPRRAPIIDLFGDVVEYTSCVEDVMDRLLIAGTVTKRADKRGRPAWGNRYKRLWFQHAPIDLFCVLPPAQYGLLLMIRTGPAEFSHKMVTERYRGGFLPNGYRVVDGQFEDMEKQILYTVPDERELFRLYDLPYLEPMERTLSPEPWRRALQEAS